MPERTANDLPGWKRTTDANGAVHLVRDENYKPPDNDSLAGATASPAPEPPFPAGKIIGNGIILVVVLVVYFFPGMIAEHRRHRNRGAIGIMNLLLGWTLLGWIAALIWAFTENTERPQSEPR